VHRIIHRAQEGANAEGGPSPPSPEIADEHHRDTERQSANWRPVWRMS
jgi:hypothetical protein